MISKEHQRVLEAYKKGYFVNRDGDVISPFTNKVLKPLRSGKCRYYRITVNKQKVCIHKLMAYQKYGDKIFEEGIVVRHLNDDPKDNSYDNIIIGTQS